MFFPRLRDPKDVMTWSEQLIKTLNDLFTDIQQGRRMLHNIFEIGTKRLDESNIGDKKVLLHDASGDVLKYEDQANLSVGNADKLSNLTLSQVRDHNPKAHAASHQNGGADEINVEGLSGKLADEQNAGWIKGKAVDPIENYHLLRGFNNKIETNWRCERGYYDPGQSFSGNTYHETNIDTGINFTNQYSWTPLVVIKESPCSRTSLGNAHFQIFEVLTLDTHTFRVRWQHDFGSDLGVCFFWFAIGY
ncbi:MAG: hypothetical protein DRG20_00935 [Deltaproteobacteria bacterium]|nr:MAG: hypothetical protein DRG20_00935 [Deltaproteobacteria bacterium]